MICVYPALHLGRKRLQELIYFHVGGWGRIFRPYELAYVYPEPHLVEMWVQNSVYLLFEFVYVFLEPHLAQMVFQK